MYAWLFNVCPSTGSPANQTALQELMRRYNLTDEQLNREIVDSDTPVMALNFDDVEMYSTAMGLAIAKQADVKESRGNQAAMMKCLKIWKGHNPSRATYRALLGIALRLGKGNTADQVCQQLTQRKYMCISIPPRVSSRGRVGVNLPPKCSAYSPQKSCRIITLVLHVITLVNVITPYKVDRVRCIINKSGHSQTFCDAHPILPLPIFILHVDEALPLPFPLPSRKTTE